MRRANRNNKARVSYEIYLKAHQVQHRWTQHLRSSLSLSAQEKLRLSVIRRLGWGALFVPSQVPVKPQPPPGDTPASGFHWHPAGLKWCRSYFWIFCVSHLTALSACFKSQPVTNVSYDSMYSGKQQYIRRAGNNQCWKLKTTRFF